MSTAGRKSQKARIVVRSDSGLNNSAFNKAVRRKILDLAWVPRPRVMLVPTASGDSPELKSRFYKVWGLGSAHLSHLDLFERSVNDLRDEIFRQDILIIPGGNTVNALAIWRAHGVGEMIADAINTGTVAVGSSAGALAFYEAGLTDSYGPDLKSFHDGLGLLSGSFCPHAEDEVRLNLFETMIANHDLPAGIALSSNAAVVYIDGQMEEVLLGPDRPVAQKVSVRLSNGKTTTRSTNLSTETTSNFFRYA